MALSSRIMHGVAEASGLAATLVRAPPTRWSTPTSRCGLWATRPPAPRRGWSGWDRSTTTPNLVVAHLDEQADGNPNGEFLLFDGRVHTYEGVNRRINNVVRA